MLKKGFVACLFFIILSIIGCDGDRSYGLAFKRVPDQMIEAIVRNSWTDGHTRYIQVESKLKNYWNRTKFGEISEFHFSGLNPKIGDCVLVWSEMHNDGKELWIFGEKIDFAIITDRDVASCKPHN